MSESSGEGSGDGGGGGDWGVTTSWVESVLSSHHGSTRLRVKELSVSQGAHPPDAVLSDILAVKVTYEADGIGSTTIDLILKLLPQDPFSRFFVTEAQFDLREIKFYTKVVPDLHDFQKGHLPIDNEIIEMPIPKCYHARYTKGGDESPIESVLVLDNLKPKGYSVMEFSKGLSLNQAKSALGALAKLHGLSLSYKIKDGIKLEEKYPFLFQTLRATDSYQQLVERGLPQLAGFLETRSDDCLEGVLESLAEIKPDTKEIIASLLAPVEPMALITHTDFWCNNLLFKENDDCKVVDWQMVTYSRLTNDLALLIVSSLPTELRRHETQNLLDSYWSDFMEITRRFGVDVENELGYTRSDLSRDYKKSQLLALLLCIGSVDVALGNPATEQRLIELLRDLHQEGILSKEVLD